MRNENMNEPQNQQSCQTAVMVSAGSVNKMKSYNVNIYCGLQETYDKNKTNSIEDVFKICDDFVNEVKDCVSVTETNFRYVDGSEKGIIVGYINYPRFPRTEKEILERALQLANKLMIGLNQFRVTIVTDKESIMLENDNVLR